DDRSLELDTIVRTTQNKIYVQVPADRKDLADGFPVKAEELFKFSGLIIGDVEANYFSAAQQELIREFANRRGGGILFLGGRATLSDGGYPHSPLAELVPVKLLDRKDTFHRDPGTFELSPLGRDSIICRLEEKPERNGERWKKMPVLADFQEVGEAKPGAVVLADVSAKGKGNSPLLVTENYGRGRTALFATSGSWRWQMLQPVEDMTHEMFWRQLMRWLITDTPGRVISSTPKPVLADETTVHLRAEVRDKSFKTLSNVRAQAHVVVPEGVAADVELNPASLEEGVYTADYTAEKPGSYVAEISVRAPEAASPDKSKPEDADM